MLRHVWSNYERHAFGKDQLKPVTGRGVDSWGGVAQTLVDSLDTCLGVSGFWALKKANLGHWGTLRIFLHFLAYPWAPFRWLGHFYLDYFLDFCDFSLWSSTTDGSVCSHHPLARLWMMGFHEEFHRAAEWAEANLNFDKDLNVPLGAVAAEDVAWCCDVCIINHRLKMETELERRLNVEVFKSKLGKKRHPSSTTIGP